MSADEFMECDTCRVQSGTPVLCAGCYHNRRLIAHLQTQLNLRARGYPIVVTEIGELHRRSRAESVLYLLAAEWAALRWAPDRKKWEWSIGNTSGSTDTLTEAVDLMCMTRANQIVEGKA